MFKRLAALLSLPLILTVAAASTAPARAATLTVDAIDFGWYDNQGLHAPDNRNTVTGRLFTHPDFGSMFRSFYAFDLRGLNLNPHDTVRSASLRFAVDNGFARGQNETKEVTLFDFVGSIDDLLAGRGGVSAFEDLGRGATYGSQAVTVAADAPMPGFSVLLNTQAGQDIMAARSSVSGLLVIGAALIDALLDQDDNWWDAGGNSGRSAATLIITTEAAAAVNGVPEPAAWALLGAAALAAGAGRRRHGGRLNS